MKRRLYPLLISVLLYASCAIAPRAEIPTATATAQIPRTPSPVSTGRPPSNMPVTLPEQSVTPIPLSGPIADPSAEVSGLAWYGNFLIILPQYPNDFDEMGDGFLYYLPKDEILACLDGQHLGPLEPRPIQLIASDLRKKIDHYQGFESIGFLGDRVFLTIEAGKGTDMTGYLVAGKIAPDLSALLLDTSKLTRIPPQAVSANRADEAMLLLPDKVITFYEVNGQQITPHPVAHVFTFDLQPEGTISMPNIEYRITDTAWATDNQFWAINYFFPGDVDLWPGNDPIRDAFGEGPTHAQSLQVERLLRFQYSDSGITLMNVPPVELVLSNESRNWEGLVVLDDRGFLMATDEHPTTLLAFVPFPK